jgi:hypothetical protein
MKKTRREAIKSGEMYYKTNKPCKYGHYSKRITYDGSCYECRMRNQREERRKISEAHPQTEESGTDCG